MNLEELKCIKEQLSKGVLVSKQTWLKILDEAIKTKIALNYQKAHLTKLP